MSLLIKAKTLQNKTIKARKKSTGEVVEMKFCYLKTKGFCGVWKEGGTPAYIPLSSREHLSYYVFMPECNQL